MTILDPKKHEQQILNGEDVVAIRAPHLPKQCRYESSEPFFLMSSVDTR